MRIQENYHRIRKEVPESVTIVAAAKTRTPEEVRAVIEAGATDIGENYVQEAETMRKALGREAEKVRWHLIGHLQTNKVNKALDIFDVIQTVDSVKLARALDKRVQAPFPVLIEINSAREPQKSGLFPEDAEPVIREIATLENVLVKGLMTMGPRFGNPEATRPFFKATRKLFDELVLRNIPGVEMEVLSMGMSNTYRVAIEEGSTMIRPGAVLFGARPS